MSAPQLQFSSTLLPQTNDVDEIRRAFLDLLAKVNQVSANVKSGGDALNVQDGLGHTVHQIPDGNILNQSYAMGHLYLYSHNNADYTLYSGINTLPLNVWTTIKPKEDSLSNINGVRLKIYVESIPASIPSNLSQVSIYGRASGTTWNPSVTDVIIGYERSQTYSSNTITDITSTEIIDIPLGINNSVDIYINCAGGASPLALVLIHQLGVWI